MPVQAIPGLPGRALPRQATPGQAHHRLACRPGPASPCVFCQCRPPVPRLAMPVLDRRCLASRSCPATPGLDLPCLAMTALPCRTGTSAPGPAMTSPALTAWPRRAWPIRAAHGLALTAWPRHAWPIRATHCPRLALTAWLGPACLSWPRCPCLARTAEPGDPARGPAAQSLDGRTTPCPNSPVVLARTAKPPAP